MKVFILLEYHHSSIKPGTYVPSRIDERVHGVYDTREGAEKAKARIMSRRDFGYLSIIAKRIKGQSSEKTDFYNKLIDSLEKINKDKLDTWVSL